MPQHSNTGYTQIIKPTGRTSRNNSNNSNNRGYAGIMKHSANTSSGKEPLIMADLLAKQSSYLNNNFNMDADIDTRTTTTNNNNNINNNNNDNNNNQNYNDDMLLLNNSYTNAIAPEYINDKSLLDIDDYVERDIDVFDDDDDDNEYEEEVQDDDDDDDDDLIFIKEQPVQHYGVFGPSKYKKQRTISLPQLPHAKLNYLINNNENSTLDSNIINTIPRIQNDDELLHLTGSSTKTIDGNKSVNLNVVHSVSPDLLSSMNNTENYTTDNELHTIDTNNNNNNNNNNNKFFQTDKDGHYVYQKDDIFGSNGRFISIDLLGQGTFGKVLKCFDKRDNQFVAVKIIRSIDRYREAAKTELRILNTISQNDPRGTFQCLILQDSFDYKNHICLVTNLYGKSIYDFMCSNGIARFPGSHIQAIARQLIRSMCFLHDLGIIHTDLKPENILLCNESYNQYDLPDDIVNTLSARRKLASNGGKRKILRDPEIKIIDFGSAIFHNEYHPPIISTRHYRAPEIVMGLGWSFPCDIWSIACVLVELATGESLYPIHENFEHLIMMQRINGEPIPPKLIDKMFYKYKHKLGNLPSDLNSTVLKHFDRENFTLVWPEVNKRGETVTSMKSIKRVLDNSQRLDIMISKFLKIDYNNNNFKINWDLSPEQNWYSIKSSLNQGSNPISYSSSPPLDRETFLFWYYFVDLLAKMFEFDPTKRITARDALNHEWFDLGILDDGITNYESSGRDFTI